MDPLNKNIWVVILAGILFSIFFPAVGILLSPAVQYLFMALMFMSTLNIQPNKILAEVHRPGKTLSSLFIIHLVSPFIILFLRHLFTEDIFLGLIIASSISSGISTVFLTKIYGGEPSRSLVVTSLSNILAPLTIPLLVMIFARQDVQIDFFEMSFTIIKLIIIPSIIAQVVARRKDWTDKINTHRIRINVAILLLIIIGIVSPVRGYIFENLLLSLQLAAVVGVLISLNFFLGFTLGNTIETKISYGVTASFKNFALSTVLALTLFNSMVALPAIMYSVMNSFLLIPMQWFIEGQKYGQS